MPGEKMRSLRVNAIGRGQKMNTGLRRILLGFGTAAALALVAAGYLVFEQVHPSLPPNLAALGQVRLARETGSTLSLAQAVTPHAATLIAFWASWCGPCHNEAAKIAALRQQYNASDLSILYLNVDDMPNAAATAAFLRSSHAQSLPVFYAGYSGWKAITGNRAMTLPRSYVFDRSGTASAAFAGFDKTVTSGELERSLAKAVAG